MRVDLEVRLDAIAAGRCLEYITDGAGGEAITPYEHGDIGLRDDEPEADAVFIHLSYSQLSLLWVLDELHCNKLEEISDFIRCFSHNIRLEAENSDVERKRVYIQLFWHPSVKGSGTIVVKGSGITVRIYYY